MFPRWSIIALLLSIPYTLCAQINRVRFQRMTPEERFSFVDEYLTKHWEGFYDAVGLPDPQSARLPDYRFMVSATKDPKQNCLFRVFWCRNQQHDKMYYSGPYGQQVVDTLSSIREYAHAHHLQAEEGICWLAWCKALLEQRGSMSVKQRRTLAYAGAIRGITLLEHLPIATIHQYHGATYDIIYHLWWMSMYLFRVEDYRLAWRFAALGDKLAHPQLDTKDGQPNGYRFYKWELLNLLASCQLRLGNWQQAQDGFQQAYTFSRSQPDRLLQDVSYSNIGVALQQQGKTAAAQPYIKRAMALVQTADAQQVNAGHLSEDYFQFRWYAKTRPLNREWFRRLLPDERFAAMDDYFTNHWRRFYFATRNAATQSSLFADYQFMRSMATDPRSAVFLRVFRVRSQQYRSVDEEVGYERALDSLVAIRDYAHQHNLWAEEGVCWLVWCKLILQYPNKMDHRNRRIRVYEGAVKGLNLLENLPVSVLRQYNGATYDLTRHLWWMSMYFYQINELELLRRVATLGNRCAQPALLINPEEILDIGDTRGHIFYKWHFINDLGTYHFQMGQLTQATTFYRQAYTFVKTTNSPVEAGVSYGNMGAVLSKQRKSAAAIPYLEQALQVAQQADNRVLAFKAIVPLAQSYLQLKQYDNAFPVLQRAVALYNPADMLVPEVDSLALIPLLAGLGEVYQHRNDLKRALYYTQFANHLAEKQRQSREASIFRGKEEKIEAEAYRVKLNQLDTDRQWAVWLRNGSIGGLGLVALVSILYLRAQRKRRQAAEQQLVRMAQEARVRTEQITQFQQVQTSALSVETDKALPQPQVTQLLELAILTEADWQQFRKLFDQVYPNYLLRLRQKYPTLTPAETRIICLSRLSLSTKEMANMLGVSADTIIKTRYRIRKKANLLVGADVGETFAQI
ncbi:tetratricopeptide repeat protein [Spirosoma radiotolerans]|uniref:HTH luxR-type domain-containing protein n=1 Tax=Spirosoma radiotolerans TaxID=1379870 RepID=A0A0E3V6T9_9BACT|nr:tetratricopeptide repeat protein [Spirosoma radiotolerans]AKD54831.1 hypothetical protein SD10_07840 [Spirosoma radiotolerans]